MGNGVIVDGRWNFQAVRDWADETSKEELQEHIERILGLSQRWRCFVAMTYTSGSQQC